MISNTPVLSFSFSNRSLETFDVEKNLLLFQSRNDHQTASSSCFEPRHLKTLDLSFNTINKQLMFLSHPMLSWLESLDLSNNNITSLHGGVTFPPQLRKLDLSHNFLKASDIGHKIKNSCRFLISLKLNHNALANSIADDIAFPRELASLDISHNGISRFHGVLNGLPHLHTLRCQNNELDSIDDVLDQLSCLAKYRQLRYLHLKENPFWTTTTTATTVSVIRDKIISTCGDSLRTLDGVPIQGRESFREVLLHKNDEYSDDVITTKTATTAAMMMKDITTTTTTNSISSSPSATIIIPFSGISPNSGASARDERRKCQALRQMLQDEMKMESTLKMEVQQLKKQLHQEQALQRSQQHTIAALKKENGQSQLEVEKLKTEIAESSLAFLECHAESKQKRVLDSFGDDENSLHIVVK